VFVDLVDIFGTVQAVPKMTPFVPAAIKDVVAFRYCSENIEGAYLRG
jgi:hypothetical protein